LLKKPGADVGFEIGPLGLISAGIYLFYMIMIDVKKYADFKRS
jgi:hypothetical protein